MYARAQSSPMHELYFPVLRPVNIRFVVCGIVFAFFLALDLSPRWLGPDKADPDEAAVDADERRPANISTTLFCGGHFNQT